MDDELPRLESIPQELVQELHMKLGRNLLRFQLIEHTFKRLLPFMHPDGQSKGDDAFDSLKVLLHGKTLGGLKKFLLQAIEVDSVHFAIYVDELVESRNNLIHYFFDVDGVTLGTVEGHMKGIAFLDEQFQFAESMFRTVHAFAMTLDMTLNPDDPMVAPSSLH
jgi:hypothetical protein